MIRACPGCGNPLNRPLAKRCLDCAWKRRLELNLAVRRKAIASGKCQRCGSQRGENGTAHYCRACADAVNAEHVARRARLLEAGLCGVCGYQARPGRKRCERCARIDAAGQRRRSRAEAAGKEG